MSEPSPVTDCSTLSKRAARRLIQRALVLAGRERILRQHIREAELVTLWAIEDRELEWTLTLDHGKLDFDRRVTKHPDVTFAWSTADDFFRQVGNGSLEPQATYAGPTLPRRTLEPLFHAFCAALRAVLHDPVDGNGDPLV
jgi:hypothetical protein